MFKTLLNLQSKEVREANSSLTLVTLVGRKKPENID